MWDYSTKVQLVAFSHSQTPTLMLIWLGDTAQKFCTECLDSDIHCKSHCVQPISYCVWIYHKAFQSKANRPLADRCMIGYIVDKFEKVFPVRRGGKGLNLGRGECDLWLTNGFMDSGHMETPSPPYANWKTRLKTLPSHTVFRVVNIDLISY